MKETNRYYTPGVCNINPTESGYRMRIGYSFLVIALFFIVVSISYSFAFIVALISFVLLFIGVLNYLQAKNNFCVVYAKNRKYNSSETFAKTAKVERKEAIQADSKKATALYIQSLLISGSIALLHGLILFAL